MVSEQRTLISLLGVLSEVTAASGEEQAACDRAVVEYSEISKLRLQPQGVQSERCVEAARARDTKTLERYARHSQFGNVRDWTKDILDDIARSKGMKTWAVQMWSEGKEMLMVEILLSAAQDGDAAERALAKNELFKLTKSVHSSVTTAAWNAIRNILK